MTATDELKPCPFCGGKAHLFVESDNDNPFASNDECNYYWQVKHKCTSWYDYDNEPCVALEGTNDIPDGKLYMQTLLTPAQAIAVTLGRGTCRLPETRIDHGQIEYNGVTEWRKCSACGAEILAYPVRYCPNCGAKAVDE